MTDLSAVRDALVSISEASTDTVSAALAKDGLARLDEYVAARRMSFPFLLASVTEDCVTKAEPFGGGAMSMRARLGTTEVTDIYIGDEATMSDFTIGRNAREAILDSLRVELVRNRVLEASDRDLLEALDAAERGGDDDVGEIRVAAHDRGLRLL